MLVQNLVSQDKYGVKCPYAMTPKGICVHNTANDASAKNEISYMKSNNNEVSYHIAIDDIESIQGIPFNRNAWHAGDGGNGDGNRNYIAIEICYSKSGGEKFTSAEKRATKEIASLLKEYGWNISNVKKHQDFSGKYCPHRTLDSGWQRFLNMVQAELDILNGKGSVQSSNEDLYRIRKTWSDAKSQLGAFKDLENAKSSCKVGYSVFDSKGNVVYSKVETPVKAPVQKPQAAGEYEISRKSEKGTFTANDTIYFRNKPYVGNDNPIIDAYHNRESVVYDTVITTNEYVWISWISRTNVRRYMPIRTYDNGVYGTLWGTIV